MKNLFIFVFVIIIISNSYAQFDKDTFFNRVNSIYHNFTNTEIKNFSLSATSDYFEFNTKEYLKDEHYFPVELYWIFPDKMFFVKKAISGDVDTSKYEIISQMQKDMQQGLKGIFIDWQRFLGGNILDEMPDEYNISIFGDTVHIEFETMENKVPVTLKFSFGINALCLKIETFYKDSGQKMITYPSFVLIDNKWLCNEWMVQIIQNKEIKSGFIVTFQSAKINSKWFPLQALISVQTKEKLNETFRRLYKFRNLVTDRDVKVIMD